MAACLALILNHTDKTGDRTSDARHIQSTNSRHHDSDDTKHYSNNGNDNNTKKQRNQWNEPQTLNPKP